MMPTYLLQQCDVAVCCSVLQCVAVCCGVSRFTHTLARCHCWTHLLQHICILCNRTQQHTATHSSTLQLEHHNAVSHCNTLQHTTTHCNTLQHTATHCNLSTMTLQHTRCPHIYCNTSVSNDVTYCNTLSHIMMYVNTPVPLQH